MAMAMSTILTKTSKQQPTALVRSGLLLFFFLVLGMGTGFGQATITIEDVSGPEDGGPITLTATLNTLVPIVGGFTVDVNTNDGTATIVDSDYTQIMSQTLTFSGTVGETQTFDVIPTTDGTIEVNEALTIFMDNIMGTVEVIDITDTATVTITNDDTFTTTITASDATAEEAGTTTGEYTVSLDAVNTTGSPITVNYTVGGTATSVDDYVALAGSVDIPDAQQ